MFGLIRKKKLCKALGHLRSEYNCPLPPKEHRVRDIDNYHYYCGNMNAVNYITRNCGCKMEDKSCG